MLRLECKNVWKQFDDKRVLQGVNLTIEPGETVVIIGQSGTGKSVLLKVLVGLKPPGLDELPAQAGVRDRPADARRGLALVADRVPRAPQVDRVGQRDLAQVGLGEAIVVPGLLGAPGVGDCD